MTSMNLDLELQNPLSFETIPTLSDCKSWVNSTLEMINYSQNSSSLVIRFVNEEEGTDLNYTYRHKNQPTNVLSFPSEMPDFSVDIPELADEISQQGCLDYLGDLVLCESVVVKEALEQKKELQQHWAHLIIHGTLHLNGYDHIEDDDAECMEALEIKILKGLGFDNPYVDHNNQ